MARKISWAKLHDMSARERRETATAALHEARANGAPFFEEDGTITVRPARALFTELFSGKVDPKRAGTLLVLLKDHGVLMSNGQRGRSGAVLRLLDPVEQLEVVDVTREALVEGVSQQDEELSVSQLLDQLHREYSAAEDAFEDAQARLMRLRGLITLLEAMDGRALIKDLKLTISLLSERLP